MVFTVLRGNHTPFTKSKIHHKCLKNLEGEVLLQDVQRVPFHVPHVFEDINDTYLAHEMLIKEVLDEHIQVKQKSKRKNSAPFMNTNLRKQIIYIKSPFWRKYLKTDKTGSSILNKEIW